MKTYRWAAAVLTAMIFVVGCEQHGGETAGGGKVAIVDMDRVARETGRAAAMEAEFKKRESLHFGDLEKLRQMVNAQLTNQKAKAATQPAEAEKLQQIYAEANAAMQQRQMQMGDDLERFHRELTAKFRQDVGPVAKRVAEQRGMTIVLAKDDRLLSFDEASDISADVVAEMKQSSPTAGVPAPGAPTMPGAPAGSGGLGGGAPGGPKPVPAPPMGGGAATQPSH